MGYAHPDYALSLREFGEPRQLPQCGGWILVRQIPGTPYKDAMGCYPLFACRDWSKLHEDLDQIGSDLISLALVTDPFAEVTPKYLEQYFDIVKPFKIHYFVDLAYPVESLINKTQRYNARRSLKRMEVEISLEPVRYLEEWMKLYENLIKRHGISGISAFSYKCFKIQLQIPGMILVIGKDEEEVLGASLIIVQDNVAYSHLMAASPEGYKINASYGILWKVLMYLKDHGVQFYDMGGGKGIKENVEDGLLKFKKGWSNASRMVYLCGRIFDRQKYESICQQCQISNIDYFPAYRAGEFDTGGKNQLP